MSTEVFVVNVEKKERAFAHKGTRRKVKKGTVSTYEGGPGGKGRDP